MKKIFTASILLGLILGCNQSENQSKKEETNVTEQLAIEVPQLSEEDKQFSYSHYAIAKDAIYLLKIGDFDNFEALVAPEFRPKDGFQNVDFMVNIANYIDDKDIAKQNQVKLEVGHNSYHDKKIPYKTYEFPFYDVVKNDTIGRSAILVTFADKIANNKIVNLSFRDY